MNVLFLGNGFDLSHGLPTKYINFLNTVNYLSNKDLTSIKTVGDIFGSEELRRKDKEIINSYDKYHTAYDSLHIETEQLHKLNSLLKDNLWYKFFLKSLKPNATWIDFEREISTVIQSFQNMFDTCFKTSIRSSKLNLGEKYIITNFNFFLNSIHGNTISSQAMPVKEKYIIESPLGSDNKIVDKLGIIKDLSQQLGDLVEGLKIYLNCFVEKTVERLPGMVSLQWIEAFKYTDYVITFNYTNTYEKLYKKGDVYHIHGNVDDNIVLGINPDASDDIETIDTTFLSFKKYYQRVKYKTDLNYLAFIEEHKAVKRNFALYIIGHSLDITDKDIIEEMFSIATKINILSYDDNDEANHISNLINIFGKTEFDRIRREKNLSFMSITDDLNCLMKENSDETDFKVPVITF